MSSLERIMKNCSAELTTKPKIMVVDDDEAICEMLTRFLAKRDTLSVIGFTNSKKALEHLKTHEVNLMLTDMAMPAAFGAAKGEPRPRLVSDAGVSGTDHRFCIRLIA